MVSVDKAIIAKLKKNGDCVEVLVDCQNALKLRQGDNVDLADIIADQKIFSDAKKGFLATESKFVETFGTSNIEEIAIEIIKKGDIQITANHKKTLLEEKTNKIIGTIVSNSIDGQTKLPIPRQRIELCFKELNIKINEHETDEIQIEQIIKKIKTLIPIKFEIFEVEIRIAHQYSSKAIGIIKNNYPNASQLWDDQGNVLIKVKVPAGKSEELHSKLNELTHGSVSYEIKEK